MERKYYLRGLGLGIAVTAIIMSVAMPDNRAMTNDEIIARAKELGMVENTVLSNTGDADDSQDRENDDRADTQDEADQSENDLAAADSAIDTDSEMRDAAVKEDEDAAEGEAVPEADNAGQEDADPENDADEENPEPEDIIEEEEQKDTTVREENNIGNENANGAVTSTTVKVITINNGDSSYTVAKKLEDVGVVASAQNFDTYLCQYGYDKRLRTGTFSIPAGASEEKIARIVSGME